MLLFLVVDHRLHGGPAHTTQIFRPSDFGVSALSLQRLKLASERQLSLGTDIAMLRQVIVGSLLSQPRFDLVPEGGFFGGIFKIHSLSNVKRY